MLRAGKSHDSILHSDYRRSTCNELLAESPRDTDDEANTQVEADDREATSERDTIPQLNRIAVQRRASIIRTLALLCACSLSVGSHYASNILGPLKSRLHREMGTSNTEFGLLIAAYSLNSTWTPFVGGILASRLGTTFTSILATGVVLIGQVLLLLGDTWGDVRLMALGLFIFGLGVSPLAVVQETIIVRFFKSHGLGVSMAFGLIAGKGASFIAARTSYPLTERFGSRAPFYVATSLAALSVVVNLVYIASSRWLVDGAGAELEAPDIAEEAHRRMAHSLTEAQALEKVAEKRRVKIRQITKLGDVFWAYVCLNIFCGMIWSPFIHLAPNIIETRFGLSEKVAASQASYLLIGSIFLYPVCGFIVDHLKTRSIVIHLLSLSSVLTMLAYAWLALPVSWTRSAIPSITTFALGHGSSPLLLVILVPRIVPLKYVSTALGVHKSMEQTGSTLFQPLAGLLLDGKDPDKMASQRALQYLLNTFLFLNVMQFLSIRFLAYLQNKRLSANDGGLHESISDTETPVARPECEPLLGQQPLANTRGPRSSSGTKLVRSEGRRDEVRRGEFMLMVCALLIVAAWVVYTGTAWSKLGQDRALN